MKAMILAAGFGTRLLPLTKKKPKALIEINGIPLLELIIRRLKYFGFTDIVINVHHHADQIIKFLRVKKNFDCTINLSIEPEILGTGGGLQHAADFLKGDYPFLLHNVDVISDLNFADLIAEHIKNHNLATLGLMNRPSNRYLLVEENLLICGHGNYDTQTIRIARDTGSNLREMAFCGIHVISPAIFDYMNKSGSFSIIDLYLEVISQGERIGGFLMDTNYWKDIGRLEHLQDIATTLADVDVQKRLFPFLFLHNHH